MISLFFSARAGHSILNKMIILFLILLMFSAISPTHAAPAAAPLFGAKTFSLKNGLQVIVVENNRTPIVTHMLWIRAGAADEPESVGGVAHYLEHLMFKGTQKIGPGDYSRRLHAVGAQNNAFTTQDETSYFATVPRDQLETLMKMERDRFLNLAPPADHIVSELNVVLEERKERSESDPMVPFQEQMNAVLMASTPYDNPVIGWRDDIKRLTWADATRFKNTWYAPNNMILVLSGAITEDQARTLATRYYGGWKPYPVPPRRRLSPPPHPADMTLTFTSDKIRQPQSMIVWRVPAYRQNPRISLAFDLLSEALDGGAATPFYQKMVVQDKIATSVTLSYDGNSWEGATLWLAGTPAPGVSPEKLAERMRQIFKESAAALTAPDLDQAKTRLIRGAIFARDSVSGPAMIIGRALITGSTLEQVETWPRQIQNVTQADIQQALDQFVFCGSTAPSCAPPVTGFVHAKEHTTNAPKTKTDIQ